MSICDQCEEYGARDCQHCDLGNPVHRLHGL